MNKPRMLVLTATGKTGMPVALQLLSEGFPVTAFVHRADQRSERLKAKGADIVVGSLTDITDMRTAMAGPSVPSSVFPTRQGISRWLPSLRRSPLSNNWKASSL
jgi:NAD(P)H dehydrogenase (quinone)